ncbi:hypothetical protein CA233_23030 [Sphingomonas sp. ABOLD]|uniref:DUF4139 domain-containing protein n=1 Tax=Sphingomonas trueperi TaxID=53317 RepID=A0A7X6BDC8_9SPHN|nr:MULTISPECIES: hypothetical protein [Sphingomonas]NJB98160.1 hypothetical protein [Sphingomonas trueperi]RSV35829.1 hypothetical protein CA233_23030 [Sphingomonas sp. ABOLD]
MLARIALALAALLAALPAAAQTLVVSDTPDAVAVTVYRDPNRGEGAIRRSWPGGYALVTETRTLQLPAGASVIRFVGVSEGMMPETAIVTGLPRGVGEKNRDARLLGPATLVDAYLKRRVTVRRTDRATGKVSESEAVIQAGPTGGVLLTTDEGIEALGCSGLPEKLAYPGVPADLAARPTLSVTTDSPRAQTVTVQLSYLAQGLDWSATYVAQLGADDTLDLFGWMTVVNGGSQAFAEARTSAVAGQPNKEKAARLPRAAAAALRLQCWPMGRTSDAPAKGGEVRQMVSPVPPPPPPAPPAPSVDIVVTGSRVAFAPVMMAAQEDLGDLKLYRIPEPVSVAARATKQVALLHRERVQMARIYAGTFQPFAHDPDRDAESGPAEIVLRVENRIEAGLGLPLPAGSVALFAARGEQPVLLGESALKDRAIGDEIELRPGDSSEVRYTIVGKPGSKRRANYRVEVTNALANPVTFELPIPYRDAKAGAPLVSYKGVPTWRVTVPANGTASLDLTLKRER